MKEPAWNFPSISTSIRTVLKLSFQFPPQKAWNLPSISRRDDLPLKLCESYLWLLAPAMTLFLFGWRSLLFLILSVRSRAFFSVQGQFSFAHILINNTIIHIHKHARTHNQERAQNIVRALHRIEVSRHRQCKQQRENTLA